MNGDFARQTLLRLRVSFRFAFRQSDWFARYALGGLFILLLAPLGWFLALGYRTEVGYRLLDGTRPILPDWSKPLPFLVNGLRAGGVIIGFYAPYLLSFWLIGTGAQWHLFAEHWPLILAFAAVVVILPPVAISLLPALYGLYLPWLAISPADWFGLLVLFALPTFLLPSAFMQVLQARSFKAAFNLPAVVRFIVGNFQPYLQAWIVSLLAALLGLAALIFSPWALFWSYPAITYAFQSIFQPELLQADDR